MKELARFEITGDKERNKMMAILGSNGYAVKLIELRGEGKLFLGIRLVVYDKEDK